MSNFNERSLPLDDVFSGEYSDFRDRLLAAAEASGATRESFDHPLAGPSGEPLAMDAIWCGDPRAKRLLILSSGLHGAEGPLGSALQQVCLDPKLGWDISRRAQSAGWSVLLLHALNPYGFAHHRRWDEQGIDVNRNFWSEPRHSSSEPASTYDQLSGWLNPNRVAWHDPVSFCLQSVIAIARFGYQNVKQAIAEGQFSDDQGLFFCGTKPSWTRRLLEQRLPGWLGDSDQVVHVDVHSGLGRFGQCKLLLDYAFRSEQQQWMDRFPADAWEKSDADGTAYNAVGGLGAWCDEQFSSHNYLYLCAEVGTYGPMHMLRTLRLENQQWRSGNRSKAITERIRNAFCPRSNRWRCAALSNLLDVLARCLDAK